MVKDEAYIDLEESFTAEILPRWNKIQKRIAGQITKAIKEHDLAKVSSIIDTISPKSFYRGKLKRINNLLRTGLIFGASRIDNEVKGLMILDEKGVMEVADIATNQFTLQIAGIVTTMKKRYMELAIKLDAQLTREEQEAVVFSTKTDVAVQKVNPINIGDVISAKGTSAGGNLVKVATSLQMSRVAAYGFSAEASARGITSYRINEVLDSRTCPVCQEMDGKTFEVKDALAKLDTLIRITDPNDLKLLAPFPKQDKDSIASLKNFSQEELRSRGFDTPPFHPRCRGLLAVDTQSGNNLVSVRTSTLIQGVSKVKVNTKVGEFLKTPAGQNLTLDERDYLLSVSAGVIVYLNLPQKAKNLIESA